MIYVTTLLDAKKYSKTAIATFYKQRWHIELDIRVIKTHMGMELLKCKTPEMVEKEIAVQPLREATVTGCLLWFQNYFAYQDNLQRVIEQE